MRGLEAENAALRQQLTILQRKVRGRVRFTNRDRLFFAFCFIAGSRRSWPETLVRWIGPAFAEIFRLVQTTRCLENYVQRCTPVWKFRLRNRRECLCSNAANV